MDTKLCSKCNKELPINEFRERLKRGKKTRQPYCISCNKEYSRQWRQNDSNKRRIISNNIKNRLRNRKFLYEYLTTHPCVDCNETDPVVLVFDHVGEKTACVSTLVNNGCAISTILDEINRCEVRCANCHAKKTAEQFGWYNYID